MKPLTYEELAEMEMGEETFLVEPIVPSSGITLIHGSTDAGKSTVLLTLQDCIEKGEDFFGLRVAKARTLYVNLDMPRRLFIARVNKADPRLSGLVVPYEEAFDSTHESFKNSLLYYELKKYTEGVELIIFDTLSDVVSASMSDETTVLATYRVFREWLPEKAILFSHHDRKAKWSVTQGGYSDPHDEDAMGSGFWRNKAQSVLHLYKRNDVIRELKHTKSHCGEKYPHTIKMELDSTGTRVIPHDSALEGARKWVEAEKVLMERGGWEALGEKEKVKAVADWAKVSERTAWRWRKTLVEVGVKDD